LRAGLWISSSLKALGGKISSQGVSRRLKPTGQLIAASTVPLHSNYANEAQNNKPSYSTIHYYNEERGKGSTMEKDL
jgi:hypothetical protein